MCCRSCLQQCLRKWRLWIRPVVMTAYGVVFLVVLPVITVTMINSGYGPREQGWFIGGIFTLMTLPIAFWEITQHLVHYTKPYLQKHIIRILWMVPIYSLNSWLGMKFYDYAIYMDTLRECYEAYVIYNFMIYLLNYLNAEMDLEATLEMKPQVKHIFPLCCLRPWEMGRELVHKCKHGILQYTVVRPLTTAVSFICELAGVYNAGEFKANGAFPYLVVVNNLSQFVAMYSLVHFYRANREELQPMRPVGKFFCIKAVIFFSFFQGFIITILVNTGVIATSFLGIPPNQKGQLSAALQDFLICIEMFLAAIAHHYTFSHKPYIDMASEQQGCCSSFLEMLDLSDVHRDVREHIDVVKNSVKRQITSRTNIYRHSGGTRDERSALLVEPVASSEENQSPPAVEKQYNSTGSSEVEVISTNVNTAGAKKDPPAVSTDKQVSDRPSNLMDFTDLSRDFSEE